MTSRHQSLPIGSCLLERILEELNSCDSLAECHIVLPTQRLLLYLTRALAVAKPKGVCLPTLWTWDRFVLEVIEDHVAKSMVMVSYQCELLMEHCIVIKNASGRSPSDQILPAINLRHAHELVHLFGELVKAGLMSSHHDDRALMLLKAYVERDWRRTPLVQSELQQRFEDLFEVLFIFHKQLTTHSWQTSDMAKAGALEKWLQCHGGGSNLKTIPRGKILIAGLTSLPELERRLLGVLAEFDRVSIWLDCPPENLSESPLAHLRTSAKIPIPVYPVASPTTGVKAIYCLPDITQEIIFALKLAQQERELGTPGHEIVIIVPDESSHGPACHALAPTVLGEVNMPLTTPWTATAVGRWLSLINALNLNPDAASIGQWILHPFCKVLFDAPAHFDDQSWQSELKYWPTHDVLEHRCIQNYLDARFDKTAGDYIRRALDWCHGQSHQIPGERLQEMTRIVAALNDKNHKSEVQDSAWTIVITAARHLAQLYQRGVGNKTSWSHYIQDLYRACSSQSVRPIGEPLSGIQIIGLTEARYIPFSYAVIVGCTEGSFPHSLPKDSLIDNNMRRALGLPAWADLEALEDTTFHLLTSRLPRVTLTYAASNGETPLIRSRWIEQLALIHKVQVINRAHLDETCYLQFSENFGYGKLKDGDKLLETMSASRLRDLIWCPYRYLLNARHIKRVEMPEDLEQSKHGQWIHKILQVFFGATMDSHLPPHLHWPLRPSSSPDVSALFLAEQFLAAQFLAAQFPTAQFLQWAHDRLDALMHHVVPTSAQRLPLFQHLTGRGWSDIAKYWAQLFAAGWTINAVETEVSARLPLTLQPDRTPVAFTGTIDVVHRDQTQGTIINDYKTGQTPALKHLALGLEPQLFLYAQALSEHNTESMAVSYFNLTEGQVSFVSASEQMKESLVRHSLLSSRKQIIPLQDGLAAVRQRWLDRVMEIEAEGSFKADPADCHFCNFAGICRKDDPRYKDRLQAESNILKWMDAP